MKPFDKDRVHQATRIIAAELLTLLAAEPASYMSRRISGACPAGLSRHEHKLAMLFGLNLVQSAIEQWPNEDDEAGRHAGEGKFLN